MRDNSVQDWGPSFEDQDLSLVSHGSTMNCTRNSSMNCGIVLLYHVSFPLWNKSNEWKSSEADLAWWRHWGWRRGTRWCIIMNVLGTSLISFFSSIFSPPLLSFLLCTLMKEEREREPGHHSSTCYVSDLTSAFHTCKV